LGEVAVWKFKRSREGFATLPGCAFLKLAEYRQKNEQPFST
jgi:hypothetical protein